MQIFKNLEEHIEFIALVLLVTALSTNQYNQYRNMFSIIDLRKYIFNYIFFIID